MRVFPATADQVPVARRFLASVLGGSALAGDALLCLSELVTNAIQHSHSRRPGGQFTVRAAVDGAGLLRVEVGDEGGPWGPGPASGGVSGRGLLIVRELARRSGVSGDAGTGWVVWFELPADERGGTGVAGPDLPVPPPQARDSAQWLREVAAHLSLAGLEARLRGTCCLDLTATLRTGGERHPEVVVDDDGYVELRYWNDPAATPAAAADVISRALATVTAGQGS